MVSGPLKTLTMPDRYNRIEIFESSLKPITFKPPETSPNLSLCSEKFKIPKHSETLVESLKSIDFNSARFKKKKEPEIQDKQN
jgi:hypothetical protein